MSYLTGKSPPALPALPIHPAETTGAVHTRDNVSTITFVTVYAKRERRVSSPTCCCGSARTSPRCATGWTTRDLAAHLVVRDRRPDASAGLILPPLRGHGERIRRRKAAGRTPRSSTRCGTRRGGARSAIPSPTSWPTPSSSSSTTRTCAAAGPAGSRATWTAEQAPAALAGRPVHRPAGAAPAGHAGRGSGRRPRRLRGRRQPAGHGVRRRPANWRCSCPAGSAPPGSTVDGPPGPGRAPPDSPAGHLDWLIERCTGLAQTPGQSAPTVEP